MLLINFSNMKKSTSLFLLATILLHSCVAYKNVSVPINEAYEKGNARVVSKLGTKFNFKNIILEDETYLGIKGKNRIKIDTAQISAIYLKDISKSKRNTILAWSLGIGVPVVFVIIMVIDVYVNGY